MSQVTLPPISAIVDFTGGLVYGLTGDNHLDELQHCMDVSQPLLDDLEKLVTDVTGLHFMSALEDLGDIIWQLPTAFAGCDDMQDDITAIENWAQIFKQPVALAETVAKNWLFHGVDIEANITKTQSDWTTEQYEPAGEDAAAVLVGLLGPINPTVGIEKTFLPELLGGFIFEMAGESPAPFGSADEFKAYVDTCYVANPKVDSTIDGAIAAIAAAGDDTDEIQAQIQVIMSVFPDAINCFNGCSQVAGPEQAAVNYINYLQGMSPDQKFSLIMKAVKTHFKEINDDAKELEKAYDAKDWFSTGMWAEKIAMIALPPKSAELFLQ